MCSKKARSEFTPCLSIIKTVAAENNIEYAPGLYEPSALDIFFDPAVATSVPPMTII